MINKTFDVVYRVAPPILTNWENFLQMKWKEAFGYANIEHQIQAFEILSPSRTPRYIISFVNECVVLQQTNPEVPIEYIVAYALLREKITQNPELQFLHVGIDARARILYNDPHKWVQYLSALHYQLSPEQALDYVDAQRIIYALSNGINLNPDDIKRKDFYTLLHTAIFQINSINKAIPVIEHCFNEYPAIPLQQRCWEILYNRDVVEYETADFSGFQQILLQHIDKKYDYAQHLIQLWYKELSGPHLIEYYHNLKRLLEIYKPAQQLIPPFVVHIHIEKFIDIVTDAWENYKIYNIECDKDKLSQYLRNQIPYIGNKKALDILQKNGYKLPDRY